MTSGYAYLFRRTLDKWLEDDGITSSAALSFYTLIGLPSLFLFTLFLGSIFLKEQIIRAAIITDVSMIADDFSIKALNVLFTQLSVGSSLNLGVIISFFVYLWSAGNIFFQLQKMINKMWGSKDSKRGWFHQLVRKRMSALVAALAFGMLVSVSTLFEVVFFVISDNLETAFSISTGVIKYASFGINLLTLIALFMYLFRVLPQANLGLKYVFTGSLLTVVFLTLGKYFIGFYLSYSNIATVYGTIGSIIVIFLWVYLSSIVVTFMAEFTGVYSDSDH
ncbi:YihY/virulence factor BrkB family protein [Methanolobus psychrotolerans]|uniref:YihY/virulence factor BrkB family protein n=1 Tax=Methanolobus psychrotolerans TaxID=1874706 RepID=UPI000B915DAA|nr:YihY/virulence factor BrkB family protein [Methanolobus psychrotolerans]